MLNITSFLNYAPSEPIDPQPVPIYCYVITMRDPKTGHEQPMEVVSTSNEFVEVLREIQWQRDAQGLTGYQIYGAVALHNPF